MKLLKQFKQIFTFSACRELSSMPRPEDKAVCQELIRPRTKCTYLRYKFAM